MGDNVSFVLQGCINLSLLFNTESNDCVRRIEHSVLELNCDA
ncbi:unnamed protein product [Schistosoma mattheei]|uniref:Uncharacterized protein n=1 Tax=Schistosoma mattheei TaxID=31246 RepID=A0A183PKA4_9TREM|nr:unnamed protein product [Schistosoma mattheei]